MKGDLSHRYKHQKQIKKRLYMIDFEQSNHQQYRSNNFFQYTGNLKRRQSDYKDLSDWSSTQINKKQDPQIQSPKQNKKLDGKKFDFLYKTRYPSALLSYNSQEKKQRPFISPMVIKFNAKILSKNLELSQQNFLKKLKQDLYVTHYKNKGLIIDRLTKIKQERQLRKTKIQISKVDKSIEASKNLPRTERISSILRLLKKRQPARMIHNYYLQGYKDAIPDLQTSKLF